MAVVDLSPVYLQCAMYAGFYSGDTAPTQYIGPINFTKIELAPITQEPDDLLSNIDGSIGEIISSVNRPTEAGTASLEFKSQPPDLLALTLGATVTTLTQSSGAVVDEAVTGVLDMWVPLANKYIDSTVTVTVTKAAVPVTGTKFEVDHVAGLYRALHADAAGSVLVSYTKAAAAGSTFAGGKAVSSYTKLYGRARNKVSDRVGTLTIHKANLTAAGPFDPVAGGFLTGALTGKLITPTGQSSPYLFDLRSS